MRKRISIFAGLLALLVGAIAFAAMGTGAYFTDSESGVISANSSNLSIERTGTQSLNMAFDNLLPGATGQHKTVTFRNDGDSPVKVYFRQHAVSGLSGLSDGREGAARHRLPGRHGERLVPRAECLGHAWYGDRSG